MSTLRIAWLVVVALLLSGCGTMADPRQWFDGDDGRKPSELVSFEPVVKPQKLWSKDIGDGSEQYPDLRPTVDTGTLYVADAEGLLMALDAATGQVEWQVQTQLPVSAGPVVGAGIVALGTAEGELVAFEAGTGNEVWRAQVSSEVLARPAIADDRVVVHTADGNLFSFDALDGTQKWRYDHKVPILTLHGSSAPVIDSGVVFVGLSGGKLLALSLDNGAVEWEARIVLPTGRTDLERMVDVDADPLVYSGTVYAAAYQGKVAAVGAGSGKEFWNREMSVYTNMAVDWQQLVVIDADSLVWSLDPDSGSGRWRVQELKFRNLSGPAIVGDYVVTADYEGYLHWLSSDDGSMAARTRASGDAIVAPLLAADDLLVAFATNGELSVWRLPEVE